MTYPMMLMPRRYAAVRSNVSSTSVALVPPEITRKPVDQQDRTEPEVLEAEIVPFRPSAPDPPRRRLHAISVDDVIVTTLGKKVKARAGRVEAQQPSSIKLRAPS